MSKRARTTNLRKGDQHEIAKWEKNAPYQPGSNVPIAAFRRFHDNSRYDHDDMQIQWQESIPSPMQIEKPILDPDAMQVQYIPKSIHRSMNTNRDQEMRHILNYLQSTHGQLNRLLKYNRGDQGMNQCRGSSMRSPYACPLTSQCYSTTQLVNYFFGDPNRVSRKLKIITHGHPEFSMDPGRITDYIRRNIGDDDIMNMVISVPSRMGTFYFPGHVFNILFLKQDGKISAFVVQSFIYSYTFFYNEISLDSKDDNRPASNVQLSCYDILKFYIEMFYLNCSRPFSPRQNLIWKYLTNNYLEDYQGNPLMGQEKPQGMTIVLGAMKCNSLVSTVKQKYNHLLRQTYSKLEVYQKTLADTTKQKRIPSEALKEERRIYQESFGSTKKLDSWKRKILQTIHVQQKG